MNFWDKEKIKAGRKAFNITQAELAFELGTRQQTVSEWELGLYKPGKAYQKLLSLAFEAIAVKKEKNVCIISENEKA